MRCGVYCILYLCLCFCICLSCIKITARAKHIYMCIADWKKYLKIVRYSSFRGIIQCGPLLITFGLTFDHVKESFFHKFGLIFDQRAKWGQLNPGTFLWRGEFVHSQTRDLKVEPFCAMSLLLLTWILLMKSTKTFATKLTVISNATFFNRCMFSF